ncbi:HTTM domain-containing protein [Streptomyces alkaliterrae]|uniref:HTTM domain-containing protein n=1 Tax=Streptomyces alkaliterrae TaxID=2213162 RepID=A0A7W3ZVF9_9ACTN|nr:HTTM domain-containing protein [Streptomyces alkaliterrae]MBB1255955.1 HTTM domain-containing protein [Streptomyces alkaliterrae]MBB1261986.1 HTTM domain-containing protein [Streptomyces alkaliterrae]
MNLPHQPSHEPQRPSAAPPQPAAGRRPLGPRIDAALTRAFLTVVSHALGPYQTAIVRIGFAATWLLFLLREIPHRHELYGPDSPWSFTLAERLIDGNKAFTVLLWSDSALWFEFVYFAAVAASAALLLGWRTRATSVLFMIGVLSLQNRSVFMGDGGDNVVHLMAIYLIFTRCSSVWSLDARRERSRAADVRAGVRPDQRVDRAGVAGWAVLGSLLTVVTVFGLLSPGWALFFWALWLAQAVWFLLSRRPGGQPHTVGVALGNLVHNAALLVIMAEVCLIYATAGWYKVQGSRWQDGTAVWYPMHLDYFAPWPQLADVLGGSALILLVITYGTVIVQVAFPFTLFNRRVKNVLLAVMIVEHLSIAVLLGLPFFSLAMIAADAVFLPTAALLWLGARATGVWGRLAPPARTGRTPAPGAMPAPAPTPAAGSPQPETPLAATSDADPRGAGR